MAKNGCEGCKYNLTDDVATSIEIISTIMDVCSVCKRGVIEEYQDKFFDLYTIE